MRTRCLLLGLLLAASACGGSASRPGPIDGPYALVATGAAPGKLLALGSGFALDCKPQTNIRQLDFSATNSGDAASYLRFSLKDYEGPKAYTITYGETQQPHTVEVGVGGYAYQFDTSKRDGDSVGSSCTFELDSERAGTMTCLMLFAVRGSPDYVDPGDGLLQGFADVYARFECP
ncbi:MAG: hypothetical protein KC503_36025 [Myxococcales bacterium]|nr:hypothetical protein [Myxococcales bacterium]